MTELESETYDSIAETNRNQWNNLVRQSDHGTVYHRYGWLRAVEVGLDRDVWHLAVTKGGNPVAIMPNFLDEIDVGEYSSVLDSAARRASLRRLVSADPGYGGPLIQTNTDDCLDVMFETQAEELDGTTVYHSIRSTEPGHMRYGKYLAKRGFSPTLLSCRFLIDLDQDWEEIEAGMHKTRRHGLRNARDRGVEVEASPIDEVPLEETYRDYERNMERIDGTAFPRSFFAALVEHVPDRTVAFTATVDGEVLGRFVHLLDEEQSTMRYFLSAIGDEASYEYNVSEMLHASAMQWGKDDGFETYDFGATGAEFDDGLFRYKEKYGGEIVPILQWQRGTSKLVWPVYRLGRQIYQKVTY